MAEVRIHPRSSLDWKRMGDLYSPDQASTLGVADLDSMVCDHEEGKDGSLHLQEFEFLPGAKVDLHAHNMSEIIYVIDGSLHFGNRELEPGSSVYVGEQTLYGFTAGEQGARLLIFMASGLAEYYFKDEFVRRQAKTRGA